MLRCTAFFSVLALSACAPASAWEAADTSADLEWSEPTPAPPIEDVPDGVNEILTSEDLARLQAVGMEVYRGDSPPWIEGEYMMDTLNITYDDVASAVGLDLIETLLGFENQDAARGTLDQSLYDVVAEGTGIGGFVSGEGDCFTVWVAYEGFSHPDSCTYSMAQLFSGCIDESGIEDLQFGYILIDRSGPCEDTVQVRHRRVMEEADRLAERMTAV